MQDNRCFNCLYYYGKLTCKAFPEGIPEEILLGENGHTKPMKGQGNSIVFRLNEDIPKSKQSPKKG